LRPDPFQPPRLLRRLWRHPDAAALGVVALLFLVPVWAFPYLPTQDGPAHLSNAQILKDYGNSAAGYERFFEVRAEPLPNLTSHLLLAAHLYLFPPLVAEKVLVSLYVLGFAFSFRYFLGAFGPRCRALSPAGMLLVYNRCFWLGFYNYCLSLVLFWVILGYCVRRRGDFHLLQAVVLMLLFTAAYFTHLFGLLLSAAGAFGVAVLVPPRRLHVPLLVALAALPPACLAMDYFEQTGFFGSTSARHLLKRPLARLRGERVDTSLGEELAAIDDELLAYHAGSAVPGSIVLAGYLGLLAAFTVAGGRRAEGDGPGWLFPAIFGLLLLGTCLLVPKHLDIKHGGFLKPRLAPLPPLLWLACLREPAGRGPRWHVRAVTALLLAVNLLLVFGTVRDGNEELKRYTAGVGAVGRGHRLFVVQPDPSPVPLVNPLLHAADYYCLGTDNVNLDNYEASMPHFPVKYRRRVDRGRGNWAGYSRRDAVDVVLCWGTSSRAGGPPTGTRFSARDRCGSTAGPRAVDDVRGGVPRGSIPVVAPSVGCGPAAPPQPDTPARGWPPRGWGALAGASG
jgi:hypothetical protein